jgi:monoamine oxidase
MAGLAAAFELVARGHDVTVLEARTWPGGRVLTLKAGLASGLGDGADHVSAPNLLREAAHRALRKQSFTIRGGTDRLPKALASRLGSRIHYGTPVTRLEHDATGVRAIATQAGTRTTFSGDRLICAIPFSVLRRLDLSPGFSRDKRLAVDRLQYTSVTRVFGRRARDSGSTMELPETPRPIFP